MKYLEWMLHESSVLKWWGPGCFQNALCNLLWKSWTFKKSFRLRYVNGETFFGLSTYMKFYWKLNLKRINNLIWLLWLFEFLNFLYKEFYWRWMKNNSFQFYWGIHVVFSEIVSEIELDISILGLKIVWIMVYPIV